MAPVEAMACEVPGRISGPRGAVAWLGLTPTPLVSALRLSDSRPDHAGPAWRSAMIAGGVQRDARPLTPVGTTVAGSGVSEPSC